MSKPGWNWNLAADWFERLLIAAFSVGLVSRILFAGVFSPVNCLLLIAESAVVLFVLIRRTSPDVSRRPADWAIGVVGSALPLMVAPGGHPLISAAVASAVILVGAFIQISAKLILFRSFGVVAANRGVKRGGPYRLVRHPMYAGYMICWLGFWLFNPTWRNGLIYLAGASLMAVRILAEERVLRRDPLYQAYAALVPHRLAPMVW